jgi:hypothetical protein
MEKVTVQLRQAGAVVDEKTTPTTAVLDGL